MSCYQISDEEIDRALLVNINHQRRKVARVVGTTMGQIEPERRAKLNDIYFAKRVAVLAENGVIEHNGDLNQMGECEIRLTPETIEEFKHFLPISRHYRVVLKDRHFLAVHSVYFDSNHKIRAIDIKPSFPVGMDLESLRNNPELMLES